MALYAHTLMLTSYLCMSCTAYLDSFGTFLGEWARNVCVCVRAVVQCTMPPIITRCCVEGIPLYQSVFSHPRWCILLRACTSKQSVLSVVSIHMHASCFSISPLCGCGSSMAHKNTKHLTNVCVCPSQYETKKKIMNKNRKQMNDWVEHNIVVFFLSMCISFCCSFLLLCSACFRFLFFFQILKSLFVSVLPLNFVSCFNEGCWFSLYFGFSIVHTCSSCYLCILQYHTYFKILEYVNVFRAILLCHASGEQTYNITEWNRTKKINKYKTGKTTT